MGNIQCREQMHYLTYSPNDEDWGAVITTAGFQFIPSGAPYPLSKHPKDYNFQKQNGRVLNEFQFVYLTRGHGEFASAHCKPTTVKAGDLLILFPGEWHNYHPAQESGWDEYWVGFRGAYFEQLLGKQFFALENPVLHIGISHSLIGLYEDLLRTANDERAGYQIMLAGILQHMTSTIIFKHRNQPFCNPGIIEKLAEARRLMRANIEEPTSPEAIAAQLGVGYSLFRKTFKNYTGVSPAQYQIQLRLIRAKELLTQTALNISEIAYQLHFQNAGQFATFFKKREGLTPSEYRNRQP